MRPRSYLGLLFCIYTVVLSAVVIYITLIPPVGRHSYDPTPGVAPIFVAMLLAVVAFLIGDYVERFHPDHRQFARTFLEFALISLLVLIFLLLIVPANMSHR